LRRSTITCAAATLLAGSALLLAIAPDRAMGQAQCSGADAVPSVQTLEQAAGAVVCLVNVERAGHGLRALRANRRLSGAATRHSLDMVRRAFFSHVGPDGGALRGRLRNSGYIRGNRAWNIGETIGWGTGTLSTPNAIVAGWIASPPHHRILLGRGFQEVGVGIAVGAPEPIGELTGTTYTLDTGAMPMSR
jgi:uncharacterized protein YkwD